MDVTAEDFRRHYESLSDEALLEIDTGELVQLARSCHDEEVARRGLENTDFEEEPEDAPPPDAEGVAEEMVCIAEYDFLEEADLARGLLLAAEFPVSLENGAGLFRLMVPQDSAEQALSVLVSPLSEEELAAQAEAAGNPYEDSDEDSEEGSSEDQEEDPAE